MAKVIGIETGPEKLRIVVANTITKKFKTSYYGNIKIETMLDQIFDEVKKIENFSGIGITVPGILDLAKGKLLYAPSMNLRNVEIVKPLEDEFNVPVLLYHSTIASVLAEKLFGAGKNAKNLVYINIGTWIGTGVIADDKLILGKEGNAHELGHSVIDYNSSVKCPCGEYGHWSAYSSSRGMLNYTRLLLDTKYAGVKTLLRSAKNLNADKIFSLAKKDKVAREIVEEVGRINAIGTANVISAYDPELITIGGYLAAKHKNQVLTPITRHVKKYTINKVPKIILSPLGDYATIYGAIADFL